MGNYSPIVYVDNVILKNIRSIVIKPIGREPVVNIVLDDKSSIKGRLLTVKHFAEKMRFHISSLTKIEELEKKLANVEQQISPLNRKRQDLREELEILQKGSSRDIV